MPPNSQRTTIAATAYATKKPLTCVRPRSSAYAGSNVNTAPKVAPFSAMTSP
jgi:hypothetical protein